MTLKFPTQAEQALATFRSATKTISLAKIAHDLGAEVTPGTITTYTFDDDTSITVSGRGKSHRVETHFP